MTALSRFRFNSSSGFIPHEEIRDCEQWQFGDMALLDASAYQPVIVEPAIELSVVRDEAYAQGHDSGREAAQFEMHHAMDQFKVEQQRHMAESLSALLQSAREGVCDAQAQMAEEVLALVCELSRQVLRRELTQSSVAVLMPVIEEAIAMLRSEAEPAVIRLHPSDLQEMQSHLPTALENRPLQWVADASLLPGGCLVESAGAHIDASLPRRWERAVGALGMLTPWQQGVPDAV